MSHSSSMRMRGGLLVGMYRVLPRQTSFWMHWSRLSMIDGRFNNRRLLEPIGNIPPAEAEEMYYAQINQLQLVA